MYRETLETLEHNGRKLRVVKVADDCPSAPYNDGGSPILSLETSRWGGAEVREVEETTSYRLHPNIVSALERWWDDTEKFERYVRAFHGTTHVEWFSSSVDRSSPQYVTLDTAHWRESLGVPADCPNGGVDATEWRAYIDGDVWVLVVEEETTWARLDDYGRPVTLSERTEWETLEALGGFYGEYTDQYAGEFLREQLPHPWWITNGDGVVLARFVEESERDEALATREWPDDAEPAYCEE